MPGFLLGVRDAILVADHIPAAGGMHANDVALVGRLRADTAIAPERGEALVERIEAAVLRAALVERTIAGGRRECLGLSGELAGGNEGEAESSGKSEKAHDNLLKLPAGAGVLAKYMVALLLAQRPSRFGRAVVAA